ncbi:alpha/beta fold hydrolase [Conexibacter sp. DBS9H8]|uniref:alpha/beta fold hydrolase n=1 Tax=Conexibacter sp. DBS9H8 TaxID=2937801 RepID=UPI00200FC08D|nr:alpha/beta fold hydrolase [Conexibacter sp. DBS9H8]
MPPCPFPAARTVQVNGRGEFFLRDSDPAHSPGEPESRPVVLLLHGWIASADLNWAEVYTPLIAAGYRVLAIDHRGHGRGLRTTTPFRLAECAADAAAVLRELALTPAVIVGYSMGGAIAQLVRRDHPDVVGALVLSGTAQHWQDPQLRRSWRALEIGGVLMRLAPNRFWDWGLRRVGLHPSPETAWVRCELTRHNVPDILEAGRELSRFDSRPWLGPEPTPAAVVLTSRDTVVPPRKQRDLAAALEAPIFDAPIDHLEVTGAGARYTDALLAALAAVTSEMATRVGASR